MKKQLLLIIITLNFLLSSLLQLQSVYATDLTLNNTPTQVYFSPKGGCTEAIVKQISNAKLSAVSLKPARGGRFKPSQLGY